MIDVEPRPSIEHGWQIFGGEGSLHQGWAPDGGTIDGIMDAIVFEQRPQDSVLDVIEPHWLIFDLNQFCLTGSRNNGDEIEKERAAQGDVADRCDGIMVEYNLDSKRIVKVHPVGKLLCRVQGRHRNLGHVLEVSAECLSIGGGYFAVAQSIYPIRFLDEIAAEEHAPGLMINHDPGARVVC